MKIPGRRSAPTVSLITKEFLIGLLSIGLGAYNLLAKYGYVSWGIEIPQLVGNILLVLAGLFLWITAFRLSRYKYHTRHLL
jgi:hypothetical protein